MKRGRGSELLSEVSRVCLTEEARKIQVSVKRRTQAQNQLRIAFTDAHRNMIHRLWDPTKSELGHSSKHRKEEVNINLVNIVLHCVKGDQELC